MTGDMIEAVLKAALKPLSTGHLRAPVFHTPNTRYSRNEYPVPRQPLVWMGLLGSTLPRMMACSVALEAFGHDFGIDTIASLEQTKDDGFTVCVTPAFAPDAFGAKVGFISLKLT